MQKFIFLVFNIFFIIQINNWCAEHLSQTRIANFIYFIFAKATVLIEVENLKKDIDFFRKSLGKN